MEHGNLVKTPQEADLLLLPFMYEIIYDYSAAALERLNISGAELAEMKTQAERLDDFSAALNKKLVVFFYRDPFISLPFRNALIFRTSAYKHKADPYTWGLPAFIDHLEQVAEFAARAKTNKPAISFRGKAAPLKLPVSIAAREHINRLLAKAGSSERIKNFRPEGYLIRRRAVLSCLKAGQALTCDFLLNPEPSGPGYIKYYLDSFNRSDYFICTAGFGNYSYRLYEIMGAGRIPVFIDTDALLPCADRINWKKQVIWVSTGDADRTAQYILDFHASIHPDDFVALQQGMRETYHEYLSWPGFSRYLAEDFLPLLIPSSGGVPAAND